MGKKSAAQKAAKAEANASKEAAIADCARHFLDTAGASGKSLHRAAGPDYGPRYSDVFNIARSKAVEKIKREGKSGGFIKREREFGTATAEDIAGHRLARKWINFAIMTERKDMIINEGLAKDAATYSVDWEYPSRRRRMSAAPGHTKSWS